MKVRNVVSLQPAANPALTIRDLTYRHIREVSLSRIMGGSQMSTLTCIAESEFAKVCVTDFAASNVVDYANALKAGFDGRDGVCPATILQYMTNLGGVLQMVKLWKVDGWKRIEDEFDEAKMWMEKLNLIGKSRPRTRRPAELELERIDAHYAVQEANNEHRNVLPMRMLVKWQIASCRRIGETCRILWEDVDFEKKMYMVRDVKDPKAKIGNHMWFPALGDAWGILTAQEMVDERVFPYRSQSASQSFTLAKRALAIDNLRLHDMRREGATRLLEMGYTSSEVRLVTGHKTTNILDRVYLAPDPALLHLGPASMRNRPHLAAP